MELEKIAADLYREFPKNAEKLSREMERLSGLLEETGAAIMMEIEKEKYRKDKDPRKNTARTRILNRSGSTAGSTAVCARNWKVWMSAERSSAGSRVC